MKKINFTHVINFLIRILLIAFIPLLIIFSFLYSSNFSLLNHNYTLINGNSFYFDDEILSKIRLEKSIFNIKPIKIQNDLNKMDYIESSKVSKIYPNTILIEIIENKPLLYFQNNKQLILIDEKENLLPVDNKAKNFYEVPIVFVQKKLNIDLDKLDLTYYKEIFDIIKYSKNNFNSLYKGLNKIHISNDSYEFIYLNKTKIYLSKNSAKNELKYLSIFTQTIKKHRLLKHYLYIDMRVPNQIIVKEKKLI